jgi:divalent metal cation (Fe/Co/Zn/Cd) transporter
MVIPIRVLVSLRITLVQKLSIGVVFIVGIITMVFAIVRVVSLNSSVNGGQVSTQWLMLWAGIEGLVGMYLLQNITALNPKHCESRQQR